MRGLPSFSQLWSNFPRGTSEQAKAAIGGNLNLGWVTNTCVIRVCHALNLSGWAIASAPGLSTARGGNGQRYAFRVSEFRSYLGGEAGPPTQVVASPRAAQFGGQRGIICFEVSGWADASGHFDLWDGSQCAHAEYFSQSHEVAFWACTG
ncbi:MAG: type VI secretion system amidase effector protein Tae4 [Polyangiaceae bacterium]